MSYKYDVFVIVKLYQRIYSIIKHYDVSNAIIIPIFHIQRSNSTK